MEECELSILPVRGVGASVVESIPSGAATAVLSKQSAKSFVKFLRGFSGLAVPTFITSALPLPALEEEDDDDGSLSSAHAMLLSMPFSLAVRLYLWCELDPLGDYAVDRIVSEKRYAAKPLRGLLRMYIPVGI